MEMPEKLHVYTGAVYDSTRWDRFALREGDIVVCTPPKTGTTWTQMLCALIVHQTPDLPLPLTRLSRWLDRTAQPVEEVAAEFEAQDFRRVIKTHTPLDGLAYDARASYVVCGRDPRDAFLSMVDHLANLSDATRAEIAGRLAAVGGAAAFPSGVDEMFEMWMTKPEKPWMQDGFPWGSVFYYMSSFWKFRTLNNIHFLHYSDLLGDLDGEMRRLSAFLSVPVDEARWPVLVEAARFSRMRAKADAAAPGAHLGEWRDANAFFRKARLGEWREVLSPGSRALYDKLSRERLEPQLRLWLESGRRACDPKAR